VTINKNRGNTLGGAGVFIETSGIFLLSDNIVCQFGSIEVEAQKFGRSSAACPSPRVLNPGSEFMKLLVNDEVLKRQGFSYSKLLLAQ